MKKLLLLTLCLLSACAQDPYKLEISNNLADDHGQSIYFRSSLRSAYAGQIRRILSKKFGDVISPVLSSPNDTLAVEYIKAAKKLSFGIERERILGKIAELAGKPYVAIKIKDGDRAGQRPCSSSSIRTKSSTRRIRKGSANSSKKSANPTAFRTN